MKLLKIEHIPLLAPLVVPVLVYLQTLITEESNYSGVFVSVFTALVSYLGFNIFVLPLYRSLKAGGKQRLFLVLLSGTVGGALILSALYALLGLGLGARSLTNLNASLFGAFYGAAVAVVYCLLVRITKSSG